MNQLELIDLKDYPFKDVPKDFIANLTVSDFHENMKQIKVKYMIPAKHLRSPKWQSVLLHNYEVHIKEHYDNRFDFYTPVLQYTEIDVSFHAEMKPKTELQKFLTQNNTTTKMIRKEPDPFKLYSYKDENTAIAFRTLAVVSVTVLIVLGLMLIL